MFADSAQVYGAIESCLQYQGQHIGWIVTTDGVVGKPGAVGVDWCLDAQPTCLDGSRDHTNDLWTYYPAPARGVIRLYSPPQAGHPLALTIGGAQSSFDPTTATFTDIAAAASLSGPNGTLISDIVLAGGPRRASSAAPQTPGYGSGAVQLAFGSRLVAESYLENQQWQLTLAPGTYTVATTGTGCQPETVQIRAGATTRADVACDIP